MAQVFVSYSRRDLEIVNRLVEIMQRAGINIWIDREEIKAGKLWRTQIVQAIDTCDAFVLMLSAAAAASENVRKEMDLAEDSGRRIFIVNLDQVRIPADMRYQLAGLQFIDLQALGFDSAIHQLIETLKVELKLTVEPPVRQAEIVIQGVDPAAFGPEMQAQLLDFIAKLVKTPQSQLSIANITAGSLHLFIDMPAQAAYELKALALNRDRRFKQFGIKALKLIGDRKYVNIALGVLTATATIGFLQYLWLSMPALFPSLFGVTAGKVILIAAAVAITTTVVTAITPEVPISQQVTLISVPFNETTQNPAFTITAQVPQLTGSNDPRVQAFNQRLNEIVKKEADAFRQEFPNLTAESSLDMKYELVSRVADIWSFKFDVSFDTAGAAHPGYESMTVNYDLGQGQELALRDLFLSNSNYLEVIANYCIAELSKHEQPFEASGAEPKPENYHNWNITPDGLLITFDPGQVAPYMGGHMPTVLVPYTELQTVVDPHGPLGKILQ
ncbi:MAG TPA: TIR domain-containing protein [Anaerolineales bacterium]|nr:TIR domain-containing protein [Anaerolineales bacterium]